MELQHCHLTSYGGMGIASLLSLMQLQNCYIQQLYRLIFLAGTDMNIANNHEFQEFVAQFNQFARHHAGSEGFGKAIETVQVYYSILLEKLLDTQVLSAAEALEVAIVHLETAMREPQIRSNLQIVLLNEGLSLLEETELKMIEALETLLENSRRISLEN